MDDGHHRKYAKERNFVVPWTSAYKPWVYTSSEGGFTRGDKRKLGGGVYPKGLITLIEKVLQNKLYQCWSKYFIIIIVIIIIITTINIIIIKLQSFIINPIDFNTSYREEGGGGGGGLVIGYIFVVYL